MTDLSDLKSAKKFDGTNFQAWKFQVKTTFIASGLTSIVNGIKKWLTREGATTAQMTDCE